MDTAAAVLTELEKAETPIAYGGDLFIASTALSDNLMLVTNNIRHFSKIRDLLLENGV